MRERNSIAIVYKGSKALGECRDFVNSRRLSRILSVLAVRDGEGRSRNLQRRGAIQGRDRIYKGAKEYDKRSTGLPRNPQQHGKYSQNVRGNGRAIARNRAVRIQLGGQISEEKRFGLLGFGDGKEIRKYAGFFKSQLR